LLSDEDEEDDVGREKVEKLDYNSDGNDVELVLAPACKRGNDVPKLKKPNK